MPDDRHPIIVGVGQVTIRDQAWPDIVGPLELMLEAASRAEADSGIGLVRHIDQLTVVNVFSWDYGNAPALFADKFGLDGQAERRYLPVGGNTPQRAVNELAERLATGDIELALIVGAEALAGRWAARQAGHRIDWGRHPDALPPEESREPSHPIEIAQEVTQPIATYPLWEPALRVAAGRSPAEHAAWIGQLMSRATEVAAANPHAWFPVRRTPDELMVVTPDNRMISTPYPKRVNAIMRVDQGGALLLTTVGKARELGIPSDRWVYVLGGGDCYDVWYLTERTSYSRSPAMEKVADQAWRSSGLGIDDVAHVDLYSCFPSAIQLAMKAFGITPDDPRPMTVTGGLAYAGGPGNNYTTHSIGTMVDVLRANPGDVGLCTGLGWHVTKHSAGLYSATAPRNAYQRIDPSADQAAVDAEPHPMVETEPQGTATIEGYSVSYGRGGDPTVARCLARLDAGRRSVVSNRDPATLSSMITGEWYGREIEVTPDGGFRI
jgi:acetyl-CoA C-acetyltransferase